MRNHTRFAEALTALIRMIVPPPAANTLRKSGSLRNLALAPLRRDHFANAWGKPLKRAVTVCTLVSRTKIYGALPRQVRRDTLDGYVPPPPARTPFTAFEKARPRPAASYRAARRNALRLATA